MSADWTLTARLSPTGWDKIKSAPTGQLKITLARLKAQGFLDDREWTVRHALAQELAFRTYADNIR